MGETVTRYHVGIDVEDKAGVLAAVATAFAEHGVSIQTVRQEGRSEEHTSELQSLMRISYAVFCLKKKYLIFKLSHSIICMTYTIVASLLDSLFVLLPYLL